MGKTRCCTGSRPRKESGKTHAPWKLHNCDLINAQHLSLTINTQSWLWTAVCARRSLLTDPQAPALSMEAVSGCRGSVGTELEERQHLLDQEGEEAVGGLVKIPGDAGGPAKAALLTGVWLHGERDTSDDAGCLYDPAQLMFLRCLGAAEPGSRGAWRGGGSDTSGLELLLDSTPTGAA